LLNVIQLPTKNNCSVKFATVEHPKGSYSVTFIHNLSRPISEDDAPYLEAKAIDYLKDHIAEKPVASMFQMGEEFFHIRFQQG
jgi:hypothetical protein